MNEEEIIDIAEKIADFGWSDYDDFEKNKKALQGLLDLYNKEKEKNKELKVLIEQNLRYSHNLEKDLFENCSNYVISKDKIREKIKELEQIKNTALTERTIDMMNDKIIVLEQLLEE